jgi:hypothetical protein
VTNNNSQSDISWYDNTSDPYGISYGQWTVKWWKWMLSTPKSINPLIDHLGKNAAMNQPTENVWFLAGKLGSEDKSFPLRTCNIPVDRSILFPVINCEANPIEYPDLKSEQDLIDHVTRDENTIVEKRCFLNDRYIPSLRVKSDPLIFNITLTDDNIYDVNGGNTIACADGYWIFLKPLPAGDYMLSFRGSCENGRLSSGADYKLKIQ